MAIGSTILGYTSSTFNIFNWGNKKEKAAAPVPPPEAPAPAVINEPVAAQPDAPPAPIMPPAKRPLPMAFYGGDWSFAGRSEPIVRVIYSGEKNFGEMGPVQRPVIDHQALGTRAWQLYLHSETIHSIINQKVRWLDGKGLRLDCEPKTEALKIMGIELDAEAFNNQVESLWEVYSSTPGLVDYRNLATLNKISQRAEKNKENWGDVLVVLRVDENNLVKVQLIDGEHVSTPVGLATMGGQDEMVDNYIGYDYIWPATQNRIRNGVEIDDSGAPVAFHVRNGVGLKWTRIEARDRLGLLRAYLYSGDEYRLDDPRAMPRITPSMESSKQMDDYTTAFVGSAVERQRIPYFIEHDVKADGIDPREMNLAEIAGVTERNLDIPTDVNGDAMARTIAVSTNRQTFNMSPGSKVSALDAKHEAHYKEFYETRRDAAAGTADIPSEVVAQKFTSSYSAARGAMTIFQHTLDMDRAEKGSTFLDPIYVLQLTLWILDFKVNAPGYIDALRKGNKMVLGAYQFAKWLGDPVPEIDRLNAVKAARLLLGDAFNHMPLSTAQKVTEGLGEGNFMANLQQMQKEMEATEKAGIEPPEERLAELVAEKEPDPLDKQKQQETEEEDQ